MATTPLADQGQYHSRVTFGKTPAELLHDTTITDGAARLYAHMSWRFGSNKSNFEGQKSMAQFMGVSRATIHNRIDELAAHDWVVVVYRGKNKKTGNYTTPFYHVFDNQEDCRAFRQTYEPAGSEQIAPRPDPVERKSRKGKGGNPAFTHVNSDEHGGVNSGLHGGANSSLHGGVNSGLHELDSSYLDSSYLDNTKPFAPSGAALALDPVENVLPEGEDITPTPDDDATTPDDGAIEEASPTPSVPPVSPSPAEHQAIVALIEAWLNAAQVINPNAYANKTIRAQAKQMVSAGITPDHVKSYVEAQRRDAFWATKEIKFGKVAGEIRPWLSKHKPGWNKPAEDEQELHIVDLAVTHFARLGIS